MITINTPRIEKYKSILAIRLKDGEEVFHHNEVADGLYESLKCNNGETANYLSENLEIHYTLSEIARVIYQK